ncbi:MAG TPA: hypothetical protein VEB63_10725 [Chitinophagaceae bacterium]|nr:hypothetical protein [Chitinophagaceae bacterium]
MKEQILANLGNPPQLEELYRADRRNFKKEFNSLYPEISADPVARAWHERLNFEDEISWGSRRELWFVIIVSLIAALIAKLPDFLALDREAFYVRNIAFVVFPALTAYLGWKQGTPRKQLLLAFLVLAASAVFINLLPNGAPRDSILLACIHLPVFLWMILAFSYGGDRPSSPARRLDYLRFNADLLVIAAIIVIAGGLLTAGTLGLFSLIGVDAEEFYFRNIVTCGAAAVPVVGSYLVLTNPQLVNKVSPVIAKVFTPLVLVTLIAYLGAIVYTGKDPYNDREFLLVFNLLLIAVMAIIFFSITEASGGSGGKFTIAMLTALALVTIVVNGIALSAIVFRISEWGLTPNRLAVLVGNLLILAHLLLTTWQLLRALRDRSRIAIVENTMARFLPVYGVWAAVVCFSFPFIFNFG